MTSTVFKFSSIFLVAIAVVAGWGLVAHTADETNPLALTVDDVVLGDKNASVVMIEYASMTCGHCADFHKKTFPEIKKNYIDNGKIRFVLRDMPWDPLAMAVSKIARCAPQEQFYAFSSAFFDTQKVWSKSSDPISELKKVARLGGMDGTTVENCLNDTDLHTKVMESRRIGMEVLKVNSTPSFYIGPEVVVQGGLPYAEISKQIDKALAIAAKQN